MPLIKVLITLLTKSHDPLSRTLPRHQRKPFAGIPDVSFFIGPVEKYGVSLSKTLLMCVLAHFVHLRHIFQCTAKLSGKTG